MYKQIKVYVYLIIISKGGTDLFFNSTNFKVLEAGAELSWMKQQVHTQNIANIETPGYKSASLDFSAVFDQVQSDSTITRPSYINANITRNEDLSILQDGNNVDLEYENLELYKSYTQYTMVLSKISGQFSNYSTIINCNMN